jgi:hypothetical protein
MNGLVHGFLAHLGPNSATNGTRHGLQTGLAVRALTIALNTHGIWRQKKVLTLAAVAAEDPFLELPGRNASHRFRPSIQRLRQVRQEVSVCLWFNIAPGDGAYFSFSLLHNVVGKQ